jgi:hypothetical protein
VSDSSQGTCKPGYKFAELGKEGEAASPEEEGICIPLAVSKPVVTPSSQDECPPKYTFVATGGDCRGPKANRAKKGKKANRDSGEENEVTAPGTRNRSTSPGPLASRGP